MSTSDAIVNPSLERLFMAAASKNAAEVEMMLDLMGDQSQKSRQDFNLLTCSERKDLIQALWRYPFIVTGEILVKIFGEEVNDLLPRAA